MPITRPPTGPGAQPVPVPAPAQAYQSLYGGMNIPNQPLSADIEDRRNGNTWAQILGAKAHELMSNVQNDYNDSFGNKNMTLSDIPDVSRMQPQLIRRTQ